MTFHSQTIRRAAATIASAVMIATMAAPASAKDVESRPAKADSAVTQAASQGADKKICLVDSFTGSRMPKKVCKTERQWSSSGIEIVRK